MTLPFRPRRTPESAPETTAFDQLFLAHYAGLCQFAYRVTGSRAAAEDLVQELFLAVWRRREAVDLKDPVPYLYTAIRNRAITWSRRQRWRFTWLHARAQESAGDEPRVGDVAELSELAAAIEQVVRDLPERRRLIFTLHREQHLSYAEIAATLGLSVKTVETQMGRALRTLRERLAPFLVVALVLLGSLAPLKARCQGTATVERVLGTDGAQPPGAADTGSDS